jgi:cytidylate kinase
LITVAIDGPAAAGKSSAAKVIAKRLGLLYLDTGSMYRALGYKAASLGLDPGNEAEVLPMLANTELVVTYQDGEQRLFVNGEDVTDKIRSAECGMYASAISAIPAVREMLVAQQRKIAQGNDVVMDGRDIGTVVLPDATYKFFVTASPATRARRRHVELLAKGLPAKSVEALEQEIIKRDYDDSHRAHSPLKQAEDAHLIDTTDLTLEQVVEKILGFIKEGEEKRDVL